MRIAAPTNVSETNVTSTTEMTIEALRRRPVSASDRMSPTLTTSAPLRRPGRLRRGPAGRRGRARPRRARAPRRPGSGPCAGEPGRRRQAWTGGMPSGVALGSDALRRPSAVSASTRRFGLGGRDERNRRSGASAEQVAHRGAASVVGLLCGQPTRPRLPSRRRPDAESTVPPSTISRCSSSTAVSAATAAAPRSGSGARLGRPDVSP